MAAPQAPTTKPIPKTTRSRFLGEIGRQNYPAAPAPKGPVSIRFDFSGSRIYAYDYRQEVESWTDMGGFSERFGLSEQRMSVDSTLLLKSKGDGTATMVLQDVKMKTTMGGKAEGADRTMEMESPPIVLPGIREDGIAGGMAQGIQQMLMFLFAMPPKPLVKGESQTVPLSFPFNTMGSALTVEGAAKVTLSGFVSIEGRTCARIDTEIDITKLEVPKELKGKHSCLVTGRSVHYYDLRAGEHVSGETALLMRVAIDSEGGDITLRGMANQPPERQRFKVAMISDNLFRLTRNPALADK